MSAGKTSGAFPWKATKKEKNTRRLNKARKRGRCSLMPKLLIAWKIFKGLVENVIGIWMASCLRFLKRKHGTFWVDLIAVDLNES